MYHLLAFDDHKPTFGTRAPRRSNHKHVWIYLSNSEFISRSLPLVFLLDVLFPVLTEIAGSFTRDYGEAPGLKVVHCFAHPRLKPPGAFRDASWHGSVWMCVIKPTQCCLRRLEVKVVSPIILLKKKNPQKRSTIGRLSDFLMALMCPPLRPQLCSAVDFMIVELVKGILLLVVPLYFCFSLTVLRENTPIISSLPKPVTNLLGEFWYFFILAGFWLDFFFFTAS